jgi:hypothetical protein
MYSVSNPSTFSIRKPTKDYSTPETISATFTLQTGAAYIHPINLSSQGYFMVSMPDTTMSITFVCNEPYINVIGSMNVGSTFGYSVSKPALNSIEFQISGITDYVFSTMSLTVSKQ